MGGQSSFNVLAYFLSLKLYLAKVVLETLMLVIVMGVNHLSMSMLTL